ncbi:hypothetical protein LTR56_022560 [Elasticomyces elasticus]
MATNNKNMWLKKVLIPFWVFEMIWLLATIVFGALGLYVLQDYEDKMDLKAALDIAAIIVLAMGSISLLFDIVIIILFARGKLSPVTYLVLSCIKSIFWIFVFAIDIADAVRGAATGLAFLFSTVLFATSVGQVIYGAVIMHRKRKGVYMRGNYAGVETGYRGASRKDSPPRSSYAGQRPSDLAPNPFKDPSREPSPAASARMPLVSEPAGPSHPAFRKSGEAESYYNNEPAHHSFEMQHSAHNPATSYRDS